MLFFCFPTVIWKQLISLTISTFKIPSTDKVCNHMLPQNCLFTIQLLFINFPVIASQWTEINMTDFLWCIVIFHYHFQFKWQIVKFFSHIDCYRIRHRSSSGCQCINGWESRCWCSLSWRSGCQCSVDWSSGYWCLIGWSSGQWCSYCRTLLINESFI